MVQFQPSRARLSVMRVIFPSLIVLLILACTNVQAATNFDKNTLKQIVQLEEKYFARSFDGDSDENRVGRLEKTILGCTNSGDPVERMRNLLAATGSANETFKGAVSAPDQNEPESPPEPRPESRRAPAPTYSARPDDEDSQSSSVGDSYPHVTALEKLILGQSYVGQPLSARLARMENKAFGHASNDPDMSQRTDALEAYAQQKLGKKSPEAEANEGENGGPQSTTDYPHITALEKAILGQTYAGESLPDRLSRMETKAFGSPSNNPDFSQRTDALEAYAEKKLHKKPFNQEEKSNSSSNIGSQQQQGGGLARGIASMVGNSLLGMVGGGVGGMGMGPGFGPGFPGMGMGGMGSGMGMGGGGMRRRYNQQQNQQPDPVVQQRREDPFVYSPSPPPPDAKILTKVGWCEMQVFGQLFSNLHLPDRLGKLNRELSFEPDKSDIELMDDVGKLVKFVQTRKQAGQLNVAPK
jgi:hypothetical protein